MDRLAEVAERLLAGQLGTTCTDIAAEDTANTRRIGTVSEI